MEQELIDFLEETGSKIEYRLRWFGWDTEEKRWVVHRFTFVKDVLKKQTLYSGDSLSEALKALKGDN